MMTELPLFCPETDLSRFSPQRWLALAPVDLRMFAPFQSAYRRDPGHGAYQ
jgi:hypothetical protein